MDATVGFCEVVVDWRGGRRIHVRTLAPMLPNDEDGLRRAARRAERVGILADWIALTLGTHVRILDTRPSPEIVIEVGY